jgi:hypothetical protein
MPRRRHVALRVRLPWWMTVLGAWAVIVAVTLLDVLPSQAIGMAAVRAGQAGVSGQSLLLDAVFFLVLSLPVVTSAILAVLTYHLASSQQTKCFRMIFLSAPVMLLSFWVLAAFRLLF